MTIELIVEKGKALFVIDGIERDLKEINSILLPNMIFTDLKQGSLIKFGQTQRFFHGKYSNDFFIPPVSSDGTFQQWLKTVKEIQTWLKETESKITYDFNIWNSKQIFVGEI